jgi:hypothetical protein
MMSEIGHATCGFRSALRDPQSPAAVTTGARQAGMRM